MVGVRGFAGEISEAQRRESRKSNTDFAYEVKEGSKSEIFRRLEHRMKMNLCITVMQYINYRVNRLTLFLLLSLLPF